MVDIFIWEEHQPPPESLAPKLAGLLDTMLELEKLVLVIPEYHTEVFEAEFANLVLPHVRTLVVGPYCDFAARLCPTLQNMSSNGWPFLHSHKSGYRYRNHTLNLVRAASNVPNLTRLEIEERWNAERLEGKINLIDYGYSSPR